MGLLSFLKREPVQAGTPAAVDAASPDTIRTRARRRLIGAAVLLVGAVLVLPAIFDTKPRPLPVDIPIEIPKRDGVPALNVPPPRVAAAQPQASAAASPVATPAPATTASAVASPAVAPSAAAPPKAAAKEPLKETPKEAPKVATKPEPKPAAKAETTAKAEVPKPSRDKAADKPSPRDDATRVQAMLEGRDAKPAKAAEASTRFVVQVGAFEHAAAARDARQRVEKLGLRSFQQDVDTAQGKRIRVRLGPFGSREEADKAAAKLSGAGIKASVVPL